ncbi:hypothetical protein [Silvimonas sp.]|uniref:hypothetical protein n=1 Tax=Silvimonas sp. TaxID=2650811 RepID=UPI00284A045D|nr:hypothetical protein [Silvimonas sp.]MDR3428762.1 hypothetical protein [Silvimonas sp.]
MSILSTKCGPSSHRSSFTGTVKLTYPKRSLAYLSVRSTKRTVLAGQRGVAAGPWLRIQRMSLHEQLKLDTGSVLQTSHNPNAGGSPIKLSTPPPDGLSKHLRQVSGVYSQAAGKMTTRSIEANSLKKWNGSPALLGGGLARKSSPGRSGQCRSAI